jgi:HEAT repeat protein
VKYLQQALEDDAPQVRLAAVQGTRSVPTEVLKEMLQFAAADESPDVQFAAIEVACTVALQFDPLPLDVIGRVLAIRNDTESLRRVIRMVMRRPLDLMHSGLTSQLTLSLSDSGESLRRLAADEDELIRHGAMILIRVRPEFADIEHTLHLLETDRNPEIRKLALEILCYIANASQKRPAPSDSLEKRHRIIDALIAALADPDTFVSRLAIRLVATLREPRGIDAIRMMLSKGQASILSVVAEVIGVIGNLQDVPALQRLLKHNDEDVRAAAVMALDQLGASASVHELVKALGDRSKKVRSVAVWALGRFRDSIATNALMKASRDRDIDVRIAASVALLSNSTPIGASVLEFAKHPDRSVRLKLAWALSFESSNEQALEAIELLLGDSNADVRRAARDALKRNRSPRARRLLRDLGDAPDDLK